jgi:hypothetical protein
VRAEALILIVWAAWLGILATVLWLWSDSELVPGLLSLAALGTALLAVFIAILRPPETAERRITTSSVSTVLIVLGAMVAVNGLYAGLWLELIGAELALFGLVWLALEELAKRRGGAR